jgi:hypothetical protein
MQKMDLWTPSHLRAAAIITIICCFEHLSMVAMHNVFGKMPYPPQLEILSHLPLMKKIDTSIYPGAILLVRPTGGGKSSVWDIYSVMSACFLLTITYHHSTTFSWDGSNTKRLAKDINKPWSTPCISP